MGDFVVMSCEEVKEVKGNSDTEMESGEFEGIKKKKRKQQQESCVYGEVVKWERWMALRVLLIEADDSTRQIIAALLKKCNYKVMSSQDSVSTVYKCMLRGAADYLVKPVRRNELRNLWQHAWRRQSSIIDGNFPGDESIGRKQVEATSENDAARQTDKGSDTQSSCIKPDMETIQEFSHLIKGKSQPSGSQMHEAHDGLNQNLLMHETKTSVNDCKDPNLTTAYKGVELECQRTNTNISAEAGNALADSPREAIDFMGTFNRNFNFSSINSTCKFDSSPPLDLSLRRCNNNDFKDNVTRERPILWHPNSSAFTRYSNRLSLPQHSTLTSISNKKKESGSNSETILSNIVSEHDAATPSPMVTSQRNMIPSTAGATDQSRHTEVATSCMEQRECPSSVNQHEPTFGVNPFHHSSLEMNSSRQFYDRLASGTNQMDQKLDSVEDKGHISPTVNQSGTSSFCNGSISQLNGIAYGSSSASYSNVDQVIVRASTERKNDDNIPAPAGNSHRSIQREAALTKFRLKRKDRCYEKKVRYESRKKLAEQRPRVKGQFVRQVQVDHPTQTIHPMASYNIEKCMD
ncbi:two-component response regulator-like APRR9 isoform X2 [Gossypium arboreum]|uniref:two-component response regulator-like APRR9 isoform X2 n=1 Tax=Gossypium arboreum TaxID=29729 RepID=UPI0022F1AA1B|nr:two-component response regulator-like APRR9 isoform X2 [Gossypium arboreum]